MKKLRLNLLACKIIKHEMLEKNARWDFESIYSSNNKMNPCVNNISHTLKRFCILNWDVNIPSFGVAIKNFTKKCDAVALMKFLNDGYIK